MRNTQDVPKILGEDANNLRTVPGFSTEREYRITRKDGRMRWVQEFIGNVSDHTGKPVFVQGTIYDITERKRAEEQILAQRDLALEVAKASSLNQALPVCLQTAIQVSDMDCGGIYLVDRNSGDLKLACAQGLSNVFIEEVSYYPAHSDRAYLVKAGKPIYTQHREIGISLEFREGLRAIAVIPILYLGQVIACFNVASHRIARIPVSSRKSLEAISAMIGNAIARIQAEEALRETRLEFQTLFDSLQDFIIVLNPEGQILRGNRLVWERLGYSPEEMVGRHVIDLHPQGRSTKVRSIIADLLAGKKDLCSLPLLAKDGNLIPVETKVSPGRWRDREVLFAVSRDITERKRAEEVFRESERRHRLLADNVYDHIWTMDMNLRFTYVSPSVTRMRGYTVEEVMGQTLEETLTPASLEVARKAFAEEMAIEEMVQKKPSRSRTLELELYRKDGSTVWGETRITTLRDPEGRIFEMIGVTRDITDRRRAEEAFRESQKLLRKTFASLRDAVFILDAERAQIIDCNAAVSHVFGYNRKEILGRTTSFLHVDESTLQEFREELFAAVKKKGFLHLPEFRMRRKNGEIFCTEHSVMSFEDENGKRMGWVSVVRDITERKQAEERLRHSSEQLRSLSARLQNIREEERARAAREIHDELGQALTALKMDLAWVARRLPEDGEALPLKTQSMSTLIDKTVQSMRRICSELRPGVLDDLGLTAAIEWQMQEFQKRSGIRCRFISSKEDFRLNKPCSTAVFRIFQETLTNVTRHAKASRVNVKLGEKLGNFILEVRDNGRGINGKEISDPKSLGLLGMRERVRLFGGELGIEGVPGKGTAVMVKIPLAKAKAEGCMRKRESTVENAETVMSAS